MFLFIFESIGTSELILVGIVALIFLGPRQLPQLAKKAGKIMAEFRGTANEFKQTWEKEVNFEEEAKSLSLDSLDEEVARDVEITTDAETITIPESPAIRSLDADEAKQLMNKDELPDELAETTTVVDLNDKKNWL